MYTFELQQPGNVKDAVAMLAQGGAQPLAGGQSLVAAMKLRLAQPENLVDLSQVQELRGVRREGDNIVIGALTCHADVAASPEMQEAIPALAWLAGEIGDAQVRNMGTIGGSLANNDPAACYPAAILALSAVVQTDRRQIAAEDFIVGPFETALAEGELITAVHFPIPERAAYIKFSNTASRFALVGVFVAKRGDDVRVGVTGAAPNAFRARPLEDALKKDFSAMAARAVRMPADDLSSDLHASASYRAHLIPVLAGRAVEQALAR
jgi:carbon-monoxide dehydrogenase medium subunit